MRKKTGYIRKHGNLFEIAYYDLTHIRQFERFSSEEEAHTELAKRLAEIAQGIPVSSKPNTVKFGELCADVITDYRINKLRSVDDIECRFRLHILPVFGERKASQITTAQLKGYIVKRLDAKASPGTVKHELEAITRAFNLGMEQKTILHMPHIPTLKTNNVRSGFFTREEVERLCAHLRKPLDSFVKFAFLTGWRYGEIQGLQWRNVDLQAGEIRLDPGTTKSGDPRVFPITTELRGLLTPLAAKTTPQHFAVVASRIVVGKTATAVTPHVFSLNGKPIGAFRKSWRTACIKAGFCVKDVSGNVVRITRIFHDLRRSAAREMSNQGIPQPVIMALMGHKTDSMFNRYRIVSESDLTTARDILNGGRNGGKSTSAKA